MKKIDSKVINLIKGCLFSGILLFLTGCTLNYEIDAENNLPLLIGRTKQWHPDALDQSNGAIMYVDASTVFSDAERNSDIYKTMKSQMYQYIGTLVFIKGQEFEATECNRQKQALFNALENMRAIVEKSDPFNFANIQKAVENICDGNRQGMIITDFEFYAPDAFGRIQGPHDMDPYLSESFIKWLNKGYQIDILTEPYYEKYNRKDYLKKRFYVFFTDPDDEAPISATMIGQVRKYVVNGDPTIGHCNLVTLRNTDLGMSRVNESNSCDSEISITTYPLEGCPGELNAIDATWEDIKQYVMKLDKYNKPMKDDEEGPLPLIDGLVVNNGINYSVSNLSWHATNISKPFMVEQEKEDSLTFETMEEWDLTDAFMVEMNENNEVSVYLTPKILTSKHLYGEKEGFRGNLIRLDIDIDQCTVHEFDEAAFQWKSLGKNYQGMDAVCVSLSIDNALKDISVDPSTMDRKHLYTVFIQTQSIE